MNPLTPRTGLPHPALALGPLLWLGLALAAPAGLAQRSGQSKSGEREEVPSGDRYDFADLQLSLVLHGLEGFSYRPDESQGQRRASWAGELDGRKISIQLWVLPRESFRLESPTDVVSLIEDNKNRRQQSAKVPYTFQEQLFFGGNYGYFSYGAVGVHTEYTDTQPVSTEIVWGGLLEQQGYAFELRAEPALLAEHRQQLLECLKRGILYSGPVIDPNWTDEEAEERWKAIAPDELADKGDKFNCVRTDHYVILTNMKGNTPKKFGEVMEDCYEKIRTVFPFEDVPGQRLLPLYLFRTREEYIGFLMKVLDFSQEKAQKTGGISFGDCYATMFSSKSDPVHLHEATHQIFSNRLGLSGGGSWFQEGMAEYICEEPNDFNSVRNQVGKSQALPLRELMSMESVLFSSQDDNKGGSAAGDAYKQTGLLMEFLRQSDFRPERFQAFTQELGLVPRRNMPAIEAAILRTLGVSIEELEQKFIEYCSKRQKKMDRFEPMRWEKRR